MLHSRKALARSCARLTSALPQFAVIGARSLQKYRGYKFYPCMPYAHKYANAVTEYGIIETIRRFLPEEGLLNAIFRGGMSLAKKDVEGLSNSPDRR